ncbi:hypothetical protein EYR38_006110 [Pleurotus pulmonarius]|nr:hypothetical protein EYR38_006110 [Pleurotus pulmonarius]
MSVTNSNGIKPRPRVLLPTTPPTAYLPFDSIKYSGMLMSLGHIICTLHYFWTTSLAIVRTRDPTLMLGRPPASIPALFFLTGCIATAVQVYFVERVRRVSEKLFFPVICWSVSLVRFTLAVVMSAVVSTTTLHEFAVHWEWLVTANWVISAFVDTMITVLLFYTLARKRRVAFKGTIKLIDRLILTTIETGLMTRFAYQQYNALIQFVESSFSLLTLTAGLCFQFIDQTFAWLGLYLCVARVFTNSLLATLNARLTARRLAVNLHSVDLAHQDNEHVLTSNGTKAHTVIPMELMAIGSSSQTQRPTGVIF